MIENKSNKLLFWVDYDVKFRECRANYVLDQFCPEIAAAMNAEYAQVWDERFGEIIRISSFPWNTKFIVNNEEGMEQKIKAIEEEEAQQKSKKGAQKGPGKKVEGKGKWKENAEDKEDKDDRSGKDNKKGKGKGKGKRKGKQHKDQEHQQGQWKKEWNVWTPY